MVAASLRPCCPWIPLWCCIGAQSDTLARHKKALEQKRVELGRLLEARHDMLRRLRSEQIEVPQRSDGDGNESDGAHKTKGSRHRPRGDDEDMDPATQQSQEVATYVDKDERLFARLDFTFIADYEGVRLRLRFLLPVASMALALLDVFCAPFSFAATGRHSGSGN